jgi:hypothetical protein
MSLCFAFLRDAFVSCKKGEPSIKFIYNEISFGPHQGIGGGGLNAREGDEAKIVIEYDAPCKVKQIDYRWEIEVITKFDKSKSHKIEKTVKFEKTGTVHLNTSIVDEKDESCDFEMEINVK